MEDGRYHMGLYVYGEGTAQENWLMKSGLTALQENRLRL